MRGLFEGRDRRLRRCEIRVASAEVDHIDAALQELTLFGGDMGKRIHGKGLETLGQRRHCVLHSGVILVMEKYASSCLDMHSARV